MLAVGFNQLLLQAGKLLFGLLKFCLGLAQRSQSFPERLSVPSTTR